MRPKIWRGMANANCRICHVGYKWIWLRDCAWCLLRGSHISRMRRSKKSLIMQTEVAVPSRRMLKQHMVTVVRLEVIVRLIHEVMVGHTYSCAFPEYTEEPRNVHFTFGPVYDVAMSALTPPYSCQQCWAQPLLRMCMCI